MSRECQLSVQGACQGMLGPRSPGTGDRGLQPVWGHTGVRGGAARARMVFGRILVAAGGGQEGRQKCLVQHAPGRMRKSRQ